MGLNRSIGLAMAILALGLAGPGGAGKPGRGQNRRPAVRFRLRALPQESARPRKKPAAFSGFPVSCASTTRPAKKRPTWSPNIWNPWQCAVGAGKARAQKRTAKGDEKAKPDEKKEPGLARPNQPSPSQPSQNRARQNQPKSSPLRRSRLRPKGEPKPEANQV